MIKKLVLIAGLFLGLVLLVGFIGYSNDENGSNGAGSGESDRLTPTPSSPPKAPPGAAIGITYEEDSKIRPFPPDAPHLSRLPDGTIRLEWYNGSVFNKYFNVYRKETVGHWINIGRVTANSIEEKLSFIDQSIHKDTPYVYAITAIDVFGNESELSDPSVPVY